MPFENLFFFKMLKLTREYSDSILGVSIDGEKSVFIQQQRLILFTCQLLSIFFHDFKKDLKIGKL